MVMVELGCDDLDAENVEAFEEAITGGILVTSNTEPFSSAVQFNVLSRGCSGSKIGERRFLTAAHCLVGVSPGVTISITNELDRTQGRRFAIITKVDRHPSFDSPTVLPSAFSYDVGVFEISIDTPSIPSYPFRSTFVDVSSSFITVGYGCDESPNGAGRLGKKQMAPLSAGSPWTADQGVHTIRGTGLALICSGDSGGPVYMPSANGSWEIVGVNSSVGRVENTYSSLLARTGSVRRWLNSPAINVFAEGENGTFLNGKSAKCIGIDGASPAEGAQARQFYCDGRGQPTDNQSWELRSNGAGRFRFVNRRSGLCLGVSGGSVADGALIQQFACGAANPGNNQSWGFVRTSGDYFQVVNGKSGKCIGVDGGSTANGAVLAQFPCSALGRTDNQSWLFTR
jgi:hypothetical protein